MAIRREQNPVLPAVILVLFLALLVFLLVSRKRETGASHPQPAETCRIDGVDRSERGFGNLLINSAFLYIRRNSREETATEADRGQVLDPLFPD